MEVSLVNDNEIKHIEFRSLSKICLGIFDDDFSSIEFIAKDRFRINDLETIPLYLDCLRKNLF